MIIKKVHTWKNTYLDEKKARKCLLTYLNSLIIYYIYLYV